MRKSELFVLLIVLVSFVIGAYFYPKMPDKMASHWNAQGTVNGYMSKFWGVFMMPIVSLGMFLLFFIIPRVDPLKQNISKFRKYFDTFIALIIIFLFYIYLLTIIWNLGSRFDIIYAIIPAIALLLFYAGILIENAKRNWFIGIRTPWTMSSDRIWDKTHKIGGKLFRIAAVVSLVGIAFKQYSFYFVIIPIALATIYTMIYSYFEYKKQHKKR